MFLFISVCVTISYYAWCLMSGAGGWCPGVRCPRPSQLLSQSVSTLLYPNNNFYQTKSDSKQQNFRCWWSGQIFALSNTSDIVNWDFWSEREGQTLNLSNRDLFVFVSSPFPVNSPQKGQHGFQIVHFRLAEGRAEYFQENFSVLYEEIIFVSIKELGFLGISDELSRRGIYSPFLTWEL